MKKVLNYKISYELKTENSNEYKEEIFSNKKEAIKRYINSDDVFPIDGIGGISSLKIFVVYVNCGVEEITEKVNRFIM